MNENRIFAVALACYLLLVFFAWDDGIADKTADGRTILRFWHTYSDQEEAILRKIIHSWEQQNASWTISPVRIPFDGHKPKLRTALTVGQGPDMARVDWSFVCELSRKNAVVNLDDLGLLQVKDRYLQAPLYTNFVDGHFYGLPDQTTCVALFYNRKLFSDAGLDPDSPPKSWDEFVEVARKLTDSEKGVFGFAMENTLWWTLPFFNSFGAKIISDDGKTCLLDKPEAVQALEFKASLFLEHKVEAGAWRAGAISPEQGFINGRYAMIFMGPWNLSRFNSLKNLDYGVALIPAGPAGSSTNVGGTNVVIFKDRPHHQVCFDFLLYLTNAENQAYWCSKLNQIPVNVQAFDHVQFEDENLKVFMEQMTYAVANPVVTSYEMLENIVNPKMEAVLSGQKDAATALAAAARKVESVVLAR